MDMFAINVVVLKCNWRPSTWQWGLNDYMCTMIETLVTLSHTQKKGGDRICDRMTALKCSSTFKGCCMPPRKLRIFAVMKNLRPRCGKKRAYQSSCSKKREVRGQR
jgi:hypothetical protein